MPEKQKSFCVSLFANKKFVINLFEFAASLSTISKRRVRAKTPLFNFKGVENEAAASKILYFKSLFNQLTNVIINRSFHSILHLIHTKSSISNTYYMFSLKVNNETLFRNI